MISPSLQHLAEWYAGLDLEPAVREALFVGAILVTLTIRSFVRRTRIGTRLDSALTLLVFGLAAGAIAALDPNGHVSGPFLYVYAFFVAAIAIGSARALLVLFVDFHLRERRGAAVSRIFRDVGSVLIYFLIILAVLRFTLDLNLTSLIATSAVLTAIIGLALQDVLSSVVSGIVIEVEDPFGPGDWVRIGSYEGKVIETGWRTTRIRTRVAEVVTLPNTYLAREPVVNYSRPDPRFGETLRLEAAYEAPPDLVRQTILEVLDAEAAVLKTPVPEVRTEQFNASGIQYVLRFWIDNFDDRERIHSRVMASTWYAFRRAGVRIPFPARDVFVYSEAPAAGMESGNVRAAVARISLCAALGDENLDKLAARATRKLFGDGESIVREGESGESFFILEQGKAAVILGADRGERTPMIVAELEPGDYFGEMSLLAGEPRSATVTARGAVAVLEIGHEVFHEMVSADPKILEPISRVAAARLAQQHQVRETTALGVAPQEVDASGVLRRIRDWFGV